MPWLASHAIEIAVLAVFLVLLLWHGWEGRRESRGMVQFHVGGRSLGGVLVGLSFYSTYFSTNSFVGHAGKSFEVGISWLIVGVVILAFSLIAWHLMAGRMREQTGRLGSVTVAGYLGDRYRSRAVQISAGAIIVIASFFYVVAIFKGIGHVLASFLDIPYGLALILVAIVVSAYTSAGGFIAVVKTDAVQAVIMLVGSVLLLLAAVAASGGFVKAAGTLAAIDTPLDDGRTLGAALMSVDGPMPVGLLLGIAMAGGMKLLAEPRQITRFYAVRDRKALRTAMIVAPTAIGIGYLCLLPVGLLARVILPEGVSFEDTDRIIPYLLGDMKILGSTAGAVLLTAFMAAALSSLDSVLLVVGGTIQRDLVDAVRGRNEMEGELGGTRVAILLFTAVCAMVAYRPPGDIVSLTVFSGSLYGACFLAPLLAGLYWRKGTGEGALAAFAAGLGVIWIWKPWLAAGLGMQGIHEIFPGLALGGIAFLAVSLVTWKRTEGGEPEPWDLRSRR